MKERIQKAAAILEKIASEKNSNGEWIYSRAECQEMAEQTLNEIIPNKRNSKKQSASIKCFKAFMKI
jgi:hypothetical protein